MFIDLDRTGTIDSLKNLLEESDQNEDISGILILACEKNAFTPELINQYLKKCSKPIFGGVFPSIIYNQELLQKGTLVISIRQTVTSLTIQELSQSLDLDTFLEERFNSYSLKNKTMFVFADGLSSKISYLIDSILNSLGLKTNYIGGGAGSLKEHKPCIISNKGLLKDAAILALVDLSSGIGVAHGWEPIVGPFKVTEASENTIISVNWRPAFEVYKEVIKDISGKTFANNDFFDLAKEFPFGILKMAEEMVIRDPLKVEDNKIICFGEIPLNSLIYIMRGNKESLFSGAAKAKFLAEGSFQQNTRKRNRLPEASIFIDCVSRVMFLGSEFEKELKAVKSELPLFGALTLGEIANTGQSYLEYYNKTSVVALLGE